MNIIRFKALKDWMTGKSSADKVQRTTPIDAAWELSAAVQETVQHAIAKQAFPTRSDAFQRHFLKPLMEQGYTHFLMCDPKQFAEHSEWCFYCCDDSSIAYCDVWQIGPYPRAFMSSDDAMLFKLHWDGTPLNVTE